MTHTLRLELPDEVYRSLAQAAERAGKSYGLGPSTQPIRSGVMKRLT